MKTTYIIWMIILAGILVAGFAFLTERDEFPDVEDPVNDEVSLSEEEMARLPYETQIGERRVVFQRVGQEVTPRAEYARLPYEVIIGDETRLVESPLTLEPRETPIEFTQRFLQTIMPDAEELEAYPENIYAPVVSLHQMEEGVPRQYPISDSPGAEPAEEGISSYVRITNIPDDSIGQTEHRLDFIVSADGTWIFVWHGHRNFCRRPAQEFWQPANELCP
jgi:hypothetical protein